MSENARPPVAIRIVRPYDTEEAFLESELETVGKTSVILIGAHSRPQGVILRFEVVLQNGHVVLRGEGRVLQHKESAFRGQAGLALRFTRLDPKSKALVDRAAQIREARLSGSMPPMAVPVPEPSSNPISVPEAEPTPPPPSRQRAEAAPVESRPPTKPPGAASEAPPNPLVAIPSFAPMRVPSNIPSSLPSPAPAAPNATLAPDPMLAQLLTGYTPPPPAAASTDVPPPDPELSREEEKTRPGKVAQLIEEQAVAQAHATTTVAAPPSEDAEPPPPVPLSPPPPKAIPIEAKPPTDTAVTRAADRDALLARLRERRASMSDDERNAILNKRAK